MHALVVNKNMDYSAPIIFCSTATTAIKSSAVTKQTTIAPHKKAAIQTPVQKNNPTKTAAPKKTETVTPTLPQKIAATTTMLEEKKTEPIKPFDTSASATPQQTLPTMHKASPVAKAMADTSSDAHANGGKPEEKKVEPKLEQKKIESPVEKAVPAEIPQPIVAQQVEPKAIDIPSGPSALQIPDNAHVSNNFREVEALRRGAQLQKELVQKWRPPVGVSSDCCCDISFSVSKKGIVQQLKMIKSSGVLMFDISARQALFAMKMPQWTYGKPLIISFKQ